jgi:hypothetical protein
MRNVRKFGVVMILSLSSVWMLSCSDLGKKNGPVTLIVTATQTLQRIDLEGSANGCDQNIATVEIRSLPLQGGNVPIDNRFNDVILTSYRVSYVRTDGGHQVPEPFVRSTTGTISGGSAGSLNGLQAFVPNALNQAPFAALLPQNGGADPETGKPFVQMDILLEVFGETIAGERVSGSTRIPLDFCFHCGGCA